MATTNLTLFGSNARQIKPYVVNLFSNNNRVDSLEFQMKNYNQGNVDLSTLDPYAICYGQEFLGGLDEVKLTSEVTSDGILRIYWDLTIMSLTESQNITYQIVFKGDEGEVWTSYKAILMCNESLTADEEIVAQYPTILKQMETRIEVKTDEATQGAVDEITTAVSDQVNVAIDRVNQMANAFDASVVYIPFGERVPVENRVNNRLYYQYTNADNTKGRFEDYMGNILVSEGSGGGGGGASLPMFAHIWADHLFNDASYLLADNFSWHYASIYVTAYNKLEEQYNHENSVEETENGITFKRTPDGFKIADVSQHDTIYDLYEETGSAWFYIIDTDNKRFKLPREKAELQIHCPSKAAVNVTVSDLDVYGNGISLGLTNGTTDFGLVGNNVHGNASQGVLYQSTASYGAELGTQTSISTPITYNAGITTDPTKSGITGEGTGTGTADLSRITTERVDTDGKKYLYFYIGDYERPETEVNIGILTELANGTDLEVIVEEINEAKDAAIAEVSASTMLADLQAQVNSLKAEINTMLGRMDFANVEQFDVSNSKSYTCPSDGYVQWTYAALSSNDKILVNGNVLYSLQVVKDGLADMLFVSSGDVITVTSGSVIGAFIPQKGV